MGKKSKNKNKNKNKKGKESDGRGISTGGDSSNNNNNETVAATTTTTTTMVLTQRELEFIDYDMKLKGYSKSNDFVIGYKSFIGKQEDLAIASFKRGDTKTQICGHYKPLNIIVI